MITSQNLCKYLQYTSKDPLSEPDIADTSTLLFNRIFPVPKLPSTEDAGSFLTVIFEDIRLGNQNPNFKNSLISFRIICHIDEWRMNGALRPYALMNEIDELFNDQNVVGIGKMKFDRSTFLYANAKYMGYRLDYKIYDFN
jgi:hypothetical protein